MPLFDLIVSPSSHLIHWLLPQGLPAQRLAVRIDFQARTQAVAERRNPTRCVPRDALCARECQAVFPQPVIGRRSSISPSQTTAKNPEAGAGGLPAAKPHALYGHPNAMRQAIHSALF